MGCDTVCTCSNIREYTAVTNRRLSIRSCSLDSKHLLTVLTKAQISSGLLLEQYVGNFVAMETFWHDVCLFVLAYIGLS